VLKVISIIISFSLLILVTSCNHSKNKGQIKLNELASSSIKYSENTDDNRSEMIIHAMRKQIENERINSELTLNTGLKIKSIFDSTRNIIREYQQATNQDNSPHGIDELFYKTFSTLRSQLIFLMPEDSQYLIENLPINDLLSKNGNELLIFPSLMKDEELDLYFNISNNLLATTQFTALERLYTSISHSATYDSYERVAVLYKEACAVKVNGVFEVDIYYGRTKYRRADVFLGKVDWERFSEDIFGDYEALEGKIDEMPIDNPIELELIETDRRIGYQLRTHNLGENNIEGLIRRPGTKPGYYLYNPFKFQYMAYK